MTSLNGHNGAATHDAVSTEYIRVANQKATHAQTEAVKLLNTTAQTIREEARSQQVSGEPLSVVDSLATWLERTAQALRTRKPEVSAPAPNPQPAPQPIATSGATWWLVGVAFAAGVLLGMFLASGNKQGK
jgi:hypothetical protein